MSAQSLTERVVEVPIRGSGGEERGYRRVPLSVFDRTVRYRLLKEAVLMYRANQRVGTHSTKTRAEVAGSNKKPWRQKGTGRARAGTRKSPLWRGGGVVFGPRPRDYSYEIHRKQRRVAVRSALLAKFQDGEVMILEGLDLKEPKTKFVREALKALGIEKRCLIGTKGIDRKLVLAARNIPGVKVSPVSDLNALDLLNARAVIFTVEGFEELLGLLQAEGSSGSQPESPVGEQPPADAAPSEARSEASPAEPATESAPPSEDGERGSGPQAESEP